MGSVRKAIWCPITSGLTMGTAIGHNPTVNEISRTLSIDFEVCWIKLEVCLGLIFKPNLNLIKPQTIWTGPEPVRLFSYPTQPEPATCSQDLSVLVSLQRSSCRPVLHCLYFLSSVKLPRLITSQPCQPLPATAQCCIPGWQPVSLSPSQTYVSITVIPF